MPPTTVVAWMTLTVDGDPGLPLVHRLARYHYTPAQLVPMDVAAVVVLSAFCEFVLPRAATVSGAAWDIAGWAAYRR